VIREGKRVSKIELKEEWTDLRWVFKFPFLQLQSSAVSTSGDAFFGLDQLIMVFHHHSLQKSCYLISSRFLSKEGSTGEPNEKAYKALRGEKITLHLTLWDRSVVSEVCSINLLDPIPLTYDASRIIYERHSRIQNPITLKYHLQKMLKKRDNMLFMTLSQSIASNHAAQVYGLLMQHQQQCSLIQSTGTNEAPTSRGVTILLRQGRYPHNLIGTFANDSSIGVLQFEGKSGRIGTTIDELTLYLEKVDSCSSGTFDFSNFRHQNNSKEAKMKDAVILDNGADTKVHRKLLSFYFSDTWLP